MLYLSAGLKMSGALTSRKHSIMQLGQNHSLILNLLSLIAFLAGKYTYEFILTKTQRVEIFKVKLTAFTGKSAPAMK